MKKSIAIVIQRYGLEVNGGAELHARKLAELFASKYDVEILTTTALDAETWENYYPAGSEAINGILVRRFTVQQNRDIDGTREARRAINASNDLMCAQEVNYQHIKAIGPYCPELIDYISSNKQKYNAFLFMTYLFYHSIVGMPEAAEKAIFFPLAHDEPLLYFGYFYPIFNLPRFIMFNSKEERCLVHSVFSNEYIPHRVVGAGIDVPTQVSTKVEWTSMKYIIFAGRIGDGNGKQCSVLINYFMKYKENNPSDLKLVLVGSHTFTSSPSEDIIFTGFVTDERKFEAMASAQALVMPSEYESLCFTVLEALSLETPVIVNGHCAVTRGHCVRGQCGLYYNNYKEFEACLSYMLTNEKMRKAMGKNGKKYVENNYSWDASLDYIDEIMHELGRDET